MCMCLSRTAEEKVADAWAKAKAESEEAKRRAFDEKRKNRQSGEWVAGWVDGILTGRWAG